MGGSKANGSQLGRNQDHNNSSSNNNRSKSNNKSHNNRFNKLDSIAMEDGIDDHEQEVDDLVQTTVVLIDLEAVNHQNNNDWITVRR